MHPLPKGYLGGLELKFRSFRGRFYDLFRRVCPFFRFINMKRKKGFLYILIGGMATAFMVSCADDESFSSSRTDLLSFSTDTVSLDTTFSNVPTPTRSFWVYRGIVFVCSWNLPRTSNIRMNRSWWKITCSFSWRAECSKR